jgi:hypothetical protein
MIYRKDKLSNFTYREKQMGSRVIMKDECIINCYKDVAPIYVMCW